MANHMAEVAKLLCVEVGEEFEIKEFPDIKCTIYNDRFYAYPIKDRLCPHPSSEQVLSRLLEGTITIKHKPWQPKDNDHYYLINECGNVECDEWLSFGEDIVWYKLGNCYRTKEAAEANREKWLAFYASDEVLEV